MKATVKFTIIQRMQVIQAMNSHRSKLDAGQKQRFDQVTNLVKSNTNLFDSEEMIYIVQALRTYSKGRDGSEGLRKLADRVEQTRIDFQMKHLGKYITA
ncbi:hypothetical protein JCM9140_3110 [Halalkalibacter wakoensis JCM 9140]|uniref:Uncharacterized protein n=1 Tax=Halalkalibacter wakoensis JCM 9140 TaxID=1236970 RepID=W4Q4Y3_9BACI|nr:hypothetical protein [Halalkalibacter wakoensis]GAE27000.1 hypothetical protein JCM9140_3110 [Halalkalibacter wakoensis JCM 9140]